MCSTRIFLDLLADLETGGIGKVHVQDDQGRKQSRFFQRHSSAAGMLAIRILPAAGCG